jgi:nucleoid-associated protein YgaU
VAELTGLNDRLTREQATLRTQLESVTTEMQGLRGENIRLSNATREAQQALIDAKEQADRAALLNDRLTLSEAELIRIREQGEVAQANAAQQGKAAEDARAELAALNARLADNERAGDSQQAAVAELTGLNDRLTRDQSSLRGQVESLNTSIASLREENSRLSGATASTEQALAAAERRAANLGALTNQVNSAQTELAELRAANARLQEQNQAAERDRIGRILALQQENAAITARLRQAQGTLEQIASATRLINPGASQGFPQSAPIPQGTAARPAAAPRVHLVAEGDSLTRISLRYYGTAIRWSEIYEANREVLSTENSLRPGQRLNIP